MKARRGSATRRVALLAGAAFFVYGGYAFGVNLLRDEWMVALRAGLGQGLSSAATTVVIGSLGELILKRFGTGGAALAAAWLVPPTISGTFHVLVQLALGTQRVLLTVALSVVAGYVFAGAYVAGVVRLSRS